MGIEIKIILFDQGNTLRVTKKDPAHQEAAKKNLARIAGTDMPPDEFFTMLDYRYEGYRKWCFDNNLESTEAELFSKWLLPEYPPDFIKQNAIALAYEYRQGSGIRLQIPTTEKVIKTLYKRRYRLGIISNLITSEEIPDWLTSAGLRQYFDPVIVSCVCGLRKPGPEIFQHAAKEAGIAPENIAYVGDHIERDMPGAKTAGYGYTVLYVTPEKLARRPMTQHNRPDAVIHRQIELLELFPGCPGVNADYSIPENN